MGIKVLKFGGSSLADAEQFKRVAAIKKVGSKELDAIEVAFFLYAESDMRCLVST